MKFVVQWRRRGEEPWHDYVAEDGTCVLFERLLHAQSVAQLFADAWQLAEVRVFDSLGRVYPS